MFERDDEKGANIAPPQPDERLDGTDYASGPRSRLGGGSGPERPVRRTDKTQKKSLILSLIGQDPATRKLMGGALVIVVLLLLSVGAWSLFGEKNHQGIPVIAPPSLAVKDRPSDPGGMQIMSDDSLQGDVTGKGEVHLAPPAEQPDERVLAHKDDQSASSAAQHPLQSDIPASGKNNMTGTSAVSSHELPDGVSSDMLPPGDVKNDTKSQTAQSVPAEQNKNAATGSSAPSAQAPTDKNVARGKEESHEPKVTNDSGNLPAPKAMAPAGSYQVQLAALDSEEKAKQVWSQLQKRFPDLFGERTAQYSQTTRNGHTFIRLRTGGFADLQAAKAFCARLKAHSVSCTPAFF